MATITKRYNRAGELVGWQAKVRRHGWPPRSKTFTSRKDAESWALEVEVSMRRGEYVDRRRAERVTFGDVIDHYSAEVAITHKGATSEISRLRRFRREEKEICEHAMARLTPEQFEGYRDRRLKEVTPSTVRRELNLLHSVIESQRRVLWLLENPLGAVKRPPPADERDVRLTDDEWTRLLAACRREVVEGKWRLNEDGRKYPPPNVWLATAVELLRETGARRSELLKLKWSDVNFDESTAVLRDVKNSHDPSLRIDRAIGLSPRAVELLKELPRSLDGRVIPVSAEALKQAFERARRKAKLDHFRMHDVRHEFASRLHEAGWSPVEVAAQGGWRDLKSMHRYSNLTARHLAARFRSTTRGNS